MYYMCQLDYTKKGAVNKTAKNFTEIVVTFAKLLGSDDGCQQLGGEGVSVLLTKYC